jgi:hypothetical protein
VLRKSLYLLAFGAAVVAATPAAACCGCESACGVGPVVHPYHAYIHRAFPQPIYIVNQGPVLSGPNIITVPGYSEEVAPATYPYVGYGNRSLSYRWRHGLLYPPVWRAHRYRSGFFYE